MQPPLWALAKDPDEPCYRIAVPGWMGSCGFSNTQFGVPFSQSMHSAAVGCNGAKPCLLSKFSGQPPSEGLLCAIPSLCAATGLRSAHIGLKQIIERTPILSYPQPMRDNWSALGPHRPQAYLRANAYLGYPWPKRDKWSALEPTQA
jgi:hypothetical protein